MLHKKHDLVGALHLPTLNTIVFQWSTHSFSLSYGEKSNFNMLYMSLKSDSGFKARNKSDKLLADIAYALQGFFVTWQRNDCQGHIIPESEQGLTMQSSPRSPRLSDISLLRNSSEEKVCNETVDSTYSFRK